MASGPVIIQKEYIDVLGAIANDRKTLLKIIDEIERSGIIPSRVKQDLIALARSGLDWLDRLEKDVNNAAKKGIIPQEFAKGFADKYADFAQRASEFYTKYEVAKAYFSEVDNALEKIEEIKKALVTLFSSIIHPNGMDLANQKEINKILQEFEKIGLELGKASSYSLADIVTPDLKIAEKAAQLYISVKYVSGIDERKLQDSLWPFRAASYFEHPDRLGQLQRTVAIAIKQVEQERDAALAESWIPVSKGARGREELFFSETERQQIRKKYDPVITVLRGVERALEKRDISTAISWFESAQDMVNSTRKEITELRGVVFAERLGIGRDIRETVADALALIPAGAAIVFKIPWLAAPTEVYFAAKGAFYYRLGQITNNDELKVQGILMMAPLGFTAASKGMLQLRRFGGTVAEIGAGAAYAFTLSKQAVGVYFTGSMSYDAARQAAFVSEYGLTSERLHELIATGIMVLFGAATAVSSKAAEGITPIRKSNVIWIGERAPSEPRWRGGYTPRKVGIVSEVIPIKGEVDEPTRPLRQRKRLSHDEQIARAPKTGASPLSLEATDPVLKHLPGKAERESSAILIDTCYIVRRLEAGYSLYEVFKRLREHGEVIIVSEVLKEIEGNLGMFRSKPELRTKAIQDINQAIGEGIVQVDPSGPLLKGHPLAREVPNEHSTALDKYNTDLSERMANLSEKGNRRVGAGETEIIYLIETVLKGLIKNIVVLSEDSDVHLLLGKAEVSVVNP